MEMSGDSGCPEMFFDGFRRFLRVFTKATFSKIQADQWVARRDGFVLAKFRFRAALPFHMNPYYA